MAKLTIRTIEIDLDSATLPELARSIIGTVMNGHANGQVIAAVAEPLKLPGPANEPVTEDSEPKPRRKYKRRAKAEVANGEPAKRIGRPPKNHFAGAGNMVAPAVPRPAPTGDRLGDKIETMMMQAGRGVGTVYLAQRMPGVDLKNIKMALGQGCRHKRFVHDASDDTYSLAEVR